MIEENQINNNLIKVNFIEALSESKKKENRKLWR